jgi:pyrimidine operon attenuation protein / uracil phosphoribosyltransferase
VSEPAKLPEAEQLLGQLAARLRGDAAIADIGLVGIHTGGVWLAERLHTMLGVRRPLATLDVTFYRDDFGQIGLHPNVRRSNIPFEVEGTHIVLVDDVLYTGRTIRAAMNELFDYGRPASIKLAVLLDRERRELPIAAQFVGTTYQVRDDEMLALERDAAGALRFELQKKERRG